MCYYCNGSGYLGSNTKEESTIQNPESNLVECNFCVSGPDETKLDQQNSSALRKYSAALFPLFHKNRKHLRVPIG